jgi:hypothetical protein
MTSQQDPTIRAAIVDLASASRHAPSFEELAAIADAGEAATFPDGPLASPAIDTRVGWRGPLIAVGTAAAILVVVAAAVLLLDTERSDVTDTATSVVTTTTVASGTTVLPAEAWNPILTTTQAKTPPPAATCPEGANPDESGPADQPRPWGATFSNQGAVFDQHAGKIIFIDEKRETWKFDVCFNTWKKARPTFLAADSQDRTFLIGELVYDIDSDRTVAFGDTSVGVYDANTNTWTQRSKPPDYDVRLPGLGATYDPKSGLVLVLTDASELVAYDVDGDDWLPVGHIETRQYQAYLIGHIDGIDRLGFLRPTTDHPRRESGEVDDEGMIIDPRSGQLNGLDAPPEGVFAGFGRLNYATGTDTLYVLEDTICRLDPATLQWDCLSLAEGPRTFTEGSGLLGAMVGDSINHRVVLIYGYGPGFDGQSFYEVNDIWAIDLDAGEWIELLTPTRE